MDEFVTIKLDKEGKERRLKYDVNALSVFFEDQRVELIDVLIPDNGQLGIGAVRAILWSGLVWEEKMLTKNQVGKELAAYLSQGGKMQDLVNNVVEAVRRSGIFRVIFGDPKKGTAAPESPPPSGSRKGSRSSSEATG